MSLRCCEWEDDGGAMKLNASSRIDSMRIDLIEVILALSISVNPCAAWCQNRER